jgi:putative peptidoglycan lipid II flippase
MTRWMFPYIGFMSLVALSAGILNTWKRSPCRPPRRCC